MKGVQEQPLQTDRRALRKGGAVPAHVGSIHVEVVDVDPAEEVQEEIIAALLTHLYKSGQHNRGQCFPFFCLKKKSSFIFAKNLVEPPNSQYFSVLKIVLFLFFFQNTDSSAVRYCPDTRQLLFSNLSRICRDQPLLFLSTAVPHMSQTGSLGELSRPSGWALAVSLQPSWHQALPILHTYTQALSCYCSLLMLSAFLPQRETGHNTSEGKLGNLSVLWCFSLLSEQKAIEQRTLQGKRQAPNSYVDVKAITWCSPKHMDLFLAFKNFKWTFQSRFRRSDKHG